jgi:hypothetical protein
LDGVRYLRVHWNHRSAGYPVVLCSEIGEDRYEVRKVDEYADGRLDLAGRGIETGNTALATERTPSLAEINLDRQFRATPMEPRDFERLRDRALAWLELR